MEAERRVLPQKASAASKTADLKVETGMYCRHSKTCLLLLLPVAQPCQSHPSMTIRSINRPGAVCLGSIPRGAMHTCLQACLWAWMMLECEAERENTMSGLTGPLCF